MSSGVNLLTGHQETNHISAADEACFSSAFITGENCVVADAQEITLTADTSTGTLTVGAFVALFSGRKVICSGASGTYTLPASGTTYRHVSAGILYTKDTNNDDVEDCTFAVYTSSNDRTSEGAAADDDTGAPITTEIGAATTQAYFELFDLIVSGSAVKSRTDVYQLAHTVQNIEAAAALARVQEYTGEKTATGTGYVYFTFDLEASSILNASKVSVIKLWTHDGNGQDSAVCVFIKSSNLEGNWRTAPVLMTVNNSQMLVVFNLSIITSGTYSGKLACECVTMNNDSPVVSPANIPFDRATIFAWR